jgi:hypothetical protein
MTNHILKIILWEQFLFLNFKISLRRKAKKKNQEIFSLFSIEVQMGWETNLDFQRERT